MCVVGHHVRLEIERDLIVGDLMACDDAHYSALLLKEILSISFHVAFLILSLLVSLNFLFLIHLWNSGAGSGWERYLPS